MKDIQVDMENIKNIAQQADEPKNKEVILKRTAAPKVLNKSAPKKGLLSITKSWWDESSYESMCVMKKSLNY